MRTLNWTFISHWTLLFYLTCSITVDRSALYVRLKSDHQIIYQYLLVLRDYIIVLLTFFLLRGRLSIFYCKNTYVSNWLQINSAETEIFWCTTHRRFGLIDERRIIIWNAAIQPATSVRTLGVLMDRDLSLRSHIARLTRACFATTSASHQKFTDDGRFENVS